MVATVACGQTDAGITTNVKTKLAADDTVKAYQVDVDTQNRVVTLSGDVENLAAKERAIMIARETDGVRDVIDQIQVNEAEATSGISGDVRIDADKPDVDIDVDVNDNLENDARRGAAATKNGAEKAGDATVDGAKKFGRATAEGAKKSAARRLTARKRSAVRRLMARRRSAARSVTRSPTTTPTRTRTVSKPASGRSAAAGGGRWAADAAGCPLPAARYGRISYNPGVHSELQAVIDEFDSRVRPGCAHSATRFPATAGPLGSKRTAGRSGSASPISTSPRPHIFRCSAAASTRRGDPDARRRNATGATCSGGSCGGAWGLRSNGSSRLRRPSCRGRTGRAPSSWPSSSGCRHELLALAREADGLPIDRVKIASPFNTRLRYNVFSAFSILPRHQHRHLWQAEQHLK